MWRTRLPSRRITIAISVAMLMLFTAIAAVLMVHNQPREPRANASRGADQPSTGAGPSAPITARNATADTPAPYRPPTGGATGGSPRRPKRSGIIAWISNFTPAGGGGAIRTPAYQAIARDRCSDALDSSDLDEPFATLYGGAAAACLAALHGRTDLWPRAEAAADAVVHGGMGYECYDRDTQLLLLALVSIHREQPTVTPTRQAASNPAAGTSCPLILGISPKHGPLQGGQNVRLTGVNLPATVFVLFGDQVLDPVPSRNSREAVVTAPADQYARSVGVKVNGWPFDPLVQYTYDPPAPTDTGRSSGST